MTHVPIIACIFIKPAIGKKSRTLELKRCLTFDHALSTTFVGEGGFVETKETPADEKSGVVFGGRFWRFRLFG
jgi:hypothetical protein